MTIANPNETIEPTSGSEALADTARYMAQLMPRTQVIELIYAMSPTRVINVVNGLTVEPPLSPVEVQLATTVDHYRELMGSPVRAVALLEVLRQEVQDGGVFIGEPLPDSHYSREPV